MAQIERRRRRMRDGSLGPVRWRVRSQTPAGDERSKTFARKVDAERYAASVESDKARGRFIDPRLGHARFDEFVEQKFRPTMIDLEPTSRARDDSYLRTHILPVFGRLPISAIDYSACRAWVNELSTRRAPATIVKAAQIMNKVMTTARTLGSGERRTSSIGLVAMALARTRRRSANWPTQWQKSHRDIAP
jgi:Phage integrase, N-terminal SAM-like domain